MVEWPAKHPPKHDRTILGIHFTLSTIFYSVNISSTIEKLKVF